MKNKTIRPTRLISSDLHPLIYQVIAGLTLWLVVSVWVFFGAGDYSELTFAVVSVFFFIIVAIPYILWRFGVVNPAHPKTMSHFANGWLEILRLGRADRRAPTRPWKSSCPSSPSLLG